MRGKTILCAIFLIVLTVCQQTGLFSQEQPTAIPSKRVAVMNLKVSGDYSEQVRDWLPAMIEEELLKRGWTLVVRGERMRHIQEEHSLPRIKPETRLPENELLGATAFLELSARIQVKDIQGIVGYKSLTLGDYARASVDINGQIIDPATGLLKSSVTVGGSASGLKTAAVVSIAGDWRIGAGGYNLRGVRESLVGKAADNAVRKLVEKLAALYPAIPEQRVSASQPGGMVPPAIPLQPASTTVIAISAEPTILIELPDAGTARPGDRYGIYRGNDLVAEVEVIRVVGKRAEARILSQSSPIEPTDVARKMPLVIKAE